VLCHSRPQRSAAGDLRRRQQWPRLHLCYRDRGIALAAESEAAIGRTINIAVGTMVTIGRIADLICSQCGRSDLKPLYSEPRPGDVGVLQSDNRIARELLGFSAVINVQAGLQRAIWNGSTRVIPSLHCCSSRDAELENARRGADHGTRGDSGLAETHELYDSSGPDHGVRQEREYGAFPSVEARKMHSYHGLRLKLLGRRLSSGVTPSDASDVNGPKPQNQVH
jgi:hypothetical protein